MPWVSCGPLLSYSSLSIPSTELPIRFGVGMTSPNGREGWIV